MFVWHSISSFCQNQILHEFPIWKYNHRPVHTKTKVSVNGIHFNFEWLLTHLFRPTRTFAYRKEKSLFNLIAKNSDQPIRFMLLIICCTQSLMLYKTVTWWQEFGLTTVSNRVRIQNQTSCLCTLLYLVLLRIQNSISSLLQAEMESCAALCAPR